MDKLQFLNLSDLEPSEEQTLNNLLYNGEFQDAVIMPPETPPAWTQLPVPYHPEPMGVEEHVEEAVHQMDYSNNSPMMVPHTMQYTQMMATPSVYVGNVTANVNVHAPFMPPQHMGYPTAYMQTPDQGTPVQASRKPRQAKTPTKRSPEVRRGIESPQTPNFPQPPFPQAAYYPQGAIYPPMWQPMYPIPLQQAINRPYVPQVFTTPAATFPQVFSPTHHMPQQPPAEPREESQPPQYTAEIPEVVEKIEPELPVQQQLEVQPALPEYQQQSSEEEPVASVVDTVIVENSNYKPLAEEEEVVVEEEEEPQEVVLPPPPVVEEVKVEKSLMTKAPPANAFKSAPVALQKPPFPVRQKLADIGPEFIDPPVDAGPPKKSFASLFGSGDRSIPAAHHEANSKPLAMIHPTVHNNVNAVAPRMQNCVSGGKEQSVSFPPMVKVRPEKLSVDDYDINLQRLGEFLVECKLDYKPLLLQPRGLTNRSNYCYINAILQALIACPPFYNLMKAIPPTQENKHSKSRTPIIDSMVKFVNEFEAMSVVTRPQGRKEKQQATKEGSGAGEVVSGPAFEPVYVYKMLSAMPAAFPVEGRQEDAEEFLSCLLNGLNDEMLEAMKLIEPPTTNGLTNGVATNGEVTTNGDHEGSDTEWKEVTTKGKPVVTRRAEFSKTPLSTIFRGQMRSRVIRPNGSTDNVQPFFTLQLDIEKANSVEKALEMLVGKDEVFGGTCPQTNQEIPIHTQTSLEELPLILLLHLKCFDYKLHTCSKIMKTIEFPIDLKIDTKLLTNKNKSSNKDRQYKLVAVVYHDGKEATKGHYLTDVFHVGCGGWVRFDDATVRSVTREQVLNPRTPRVPYLLYYRRCDTINTTDHNR